QMRPILDANITKLQDQTRENWGVELELGDDAREQMIEAGFDQIMGARPLDRALTDLVREPLAMWLLRNPGVRDRAGSSLIVDNIGKEDFRVRLEDGTGAPNIAEDATPYARALAARVRDRRTAAPKPPADATRQRVM
ncbi:MAG: hypothetical protein AAF556_06465, partial [Pseudomonadota bacterium]